MCCSVLQCALFNGRFLCVAVCCNVLQCVAVCFSVMRCVAVRSSVHFFMGSECALQCIAVYCSTL